MTDSSDHSQPPLPEEKRLLYTSESIFSAATSRFPMTSTPLTPDEKLHGIPPLAADSGSTLFHCVLKRPTVEWLYVDGEWFCGAEPMMERFARELRFFQNVKRHANIVRFLAVVDDMGLLIEHIHGDELATRLYRQPDIPLGLKTRWVNQMIDALCHIHSFSLSHGTISLTNVLVTTADDTIKLIDFGNSAKNGERVYPSTVPFEAPEVRQKGVVDVDPLLADTYAFGVLVLFIDAIPPLEIEDITDRIESATNFSVLVKQYVQPVQTRTAVHMSHRLPIVSE
ncbi:kinase-like protein [Rickenella mellea]|uniref:Kinase-like protein n=1 Tax=Rickenella mellea TaxID=50990 RepID=A0A4Y7PWP3_9AGAM|nr:kinase-like protein [Rickenella mellea]